MHHLWKTLLAIALVGLLMACAPTAAEPPAQTNPTPTPAATATAEAEEAEEEAAEETAENEDEEPFDLESLILNADEGGPVRLTGIVTYTNPFFTAGVAQPLVILEDQAGFVDRDKSYLMPVESQTLGQITSNFFESPFSYSLALPIEPQGAYRDVSNSGEEKQGVQIFAVAYWTNTFGDPFLEERDLGGGGWSTAYASTRISTEFETELEIVGGQLLVYAQDGQQQFPIDFGEDGLLFTIDDTDMITLPQGYTLVNLDTVPFTFDRSRYPRVDLIEPSGAALVDFSDLSYTEAFDAFVEKLSREYAFTEYKEIDWEALVETYRPLIEQAEEDEDAELYRRTLRDLLWQIPDGHISGPFLQEEFVSNVRGGVGIAIQDVADGRVIVSYLAEDSPAERVGIELAAEIIAINDTPIQEWVESIVPFTSPFSTAHNKRLQQLVYATRFPMDTEVSLTYRNPEAEEDETVELTAVFEVDSFFHEDFARPITGYELPVQYELLENGYVYAEITSFFDNQLLTVQLWERLMQTLNEQGAPGLVLDMRQNGGGFGFLAEQMAAYFFDEPLIIGNTAYYNESLGEFLLREEYADKFYLPAEELRYTGDVVVLVGPDCASACEFFAYAMTLQNRAVVVGHYPTAGMGGSVNDWDMPEGERVRVTLGRAVDPEGNIHIEGIGVVPDVLVPVTEEVLFGGLDAVLETAVAILDGRIIVERDTPATEEPEWVFDLPLPENVSYGGLIAVGESVTGTLETGTRIWYAVSAREGDLLSLYLNSLTLSYDPFLRLYDGEGNPLLENDDLNNKSLDAGLEKLEIPLDLILLIEVAAFDDGKGGEFVLIVANAAE